MKTDYDACTEQRGEQVEVRIRGNVWIVGFIVSSLHFLSTVCTENSDLLKHSNDIHRPNSTSVRATTLNIEMVAPINFAQALFPLKTSVHTHEV